LLALLWSPFFSPFSLFPDCGKICPALILPSEVVFFPSCLSRLHKNITVSPTLTWRRDSSFSRFHPYSCRWERFSLPFSPTPSLFSFKQLDTSGEQERTKRPVKAGLHHPPPPPPPPPPTPGTCPIKAGLRLSSDIFVAFLSGLPRDFLFFSFLAI